MDELCDSHSQGVPAEDHLGRSRYNQHNIPLSPGEAIRVLLSVQLQAGPLHVHVGVQRSGKRRRLGAARLAGHVSLAEAAAVQGRVQSHAGVPAQHRSVRRPARADEELPGDGGQVELRPSLEGVHHSAGVAFGSQLLKLQFRPLTEIYFRCDHFPTCL